MVQWTDNNDTYTITANVCKDDDVVVGIRRDESQENTLNMWIVADNLRKRQLQTQSNC
jgi:aspartate-semialdehyde dehydrogenase